MTLMGQPNTKSWSNTFKHRHAHCLCERYDNISAVDIKTVFARITPIVRVVLDDGVTPISPSASHLYIATVICVNMERAKFK